MSKKRYAIVNNKGGVGKTHFSETLAEILAVRHEEPSLLVGVDPQLNISKRFGYGNLSPEESSYDIIMNGGQGKLLTTTVENLMLIGENKKLLDIYDSDIDVTQLRNRLNDYSQYTTLIDCPTGLGILTQVAMIAAENVVIVCDHDVFAFEGIQDVLDTINELNARFSTSIKLHSIILNKLDDSAASRLADGRLKEKYPEFYLSKKYVDPKGNPIGHVVRVARKTNTVRWDAKTMIQSAANTNATQDIQLIAEELFV